ncbi:Serine/threonine-protein phosphatase 1 [Cytospora mali]|uniref:Serine/threonine-protein phosphatase 1 n=1 Tax=Cytospora mali TaxID=578113 RepID=A0A194WAI5_CYTMA|nr:Serine/threonine-protein phosphatase 1 [Valsa mali]
MLNYSSRRPPRVLLAVLTIVSLTLFLSYTRITSTNHSLLWPEATFDPTTSPDDEEDSDALSKIFDDIAPMAYGTSPRPAMKGLPEAIVADLPRQHIPSRDGQTRRLVIVGDVHGQKAALEKLLDKIRFDKAADHLVLTGDLTNKGPDSAGVVGLAMELGAHAVRGNHDDRVLLARAAMDRASEGQAARAKAQAQAQALAGGVVDLETKVYEKGQGEGKEEGEAGGGGQRGEDFRAAKEAYLAREAALVLDRDDRKEVHAARTLSPAQVEWLSRLPIILKVGRIPPYTSTTTSTSNTNGDSPRDGEPPAAAFENLVVVHAGLVPAVPLQDQDPWAVMTMRTLVYPIDGERRAAVKKYLQDKASKRNRGGKPAVISDEVVEEYLRKIMEAQGLGAPGDDGRRGAGDVAMPTDGRDGSAWWGEWNRFQERLLAAGEEGQGQGEGEREESHGLKGTTVVYGHDAKSGLKVPDTYGNGKGYTYGLDSGCVYGGKLSALIIEARPEGIVHGITQVGCDKAVEVDDK